MLNLKLVIRLYGIPSMLQTLVKKLIRWQARKSPYYLFSTRDLEDIAMAVASEDREILNKIIYNPLLNFKQYHELMNKIKDEIDLRHLLSLNNNFPAELLHELANKTNSRYIIGEIFQHPNVLPKTKVLLALRGIKPAYSFATSNIMTAWNEKI